MAGQSSKKQVANNIKVLQQTHLITLVIYIFTLFFRFYLHRPATGNKMFYFTSIPLFISLFVLEKTGRPVVDSKTNKIIKEGQDLSQPGLVEYLFDIIYLTLFLNVLSILFGSNWTWWFYAAVPVFALYKIYGVIQAGKAMLGGGAQPAAAGSQREQPQKSKRQQKMEARGDKQKVRYR